MDQFQAARGEVSLLDYGAGNVRSLRNAITSLGFRIKDISSAEDIEKALVIIFPGVGCFGQAMQSLQSKRWSAALKAHILADKPFFGICIGMQSLFEGSDESGDDFGLGIIPGRVTRFDTRGNAVRVPHIGWNGVRIVKRSAVTDSLKENAVYFVHSYCAIPNSSNHEWVAAVTDYGEQRYISIVQKGNILATQFHPEKSGAVGLNLINSFLTRYCLDSTVSDSVTVDATPSEEDIHDFQLFPRTSLTKRVIACLDVRSNDAGDLVVTKGDQYDVREASNDNAKGSVRNLGKPVALCARYYADGADEVVFLNITSFRQGVLDDQPMLAVLERSSESVFVPLTVGGGIREYVDESTGTIWSALAVADTYFRAGADKVSLGSDAVYSAEEYITSGGIKTGKSSIEQISTHYGAQAVVVSIDPKRVYVSTQAASEPTCPLDKRNIVPLRKGEEGPNGQKFCWWQVTVKGGRETRNLCAVELAKACEALGAGEIMLNCIDMDGQCAGYDIPLVRAVQAAVTVPVIASSGAGAVQHFSEVFRDTNVMAALAAGIFHRNEVRLQDVKTHLEKEGFPVRVV